MEEYTHDDNMQKSRKKMPSMEEDTLEDNMQEGGKKNLIWSDDMNEFLIDQLLDQMHKGQKIEKHFTGNAYRAVAKAVSSRFKIRCLHSQIPNRLKTIRRRFNIAHAILGSGSGFGYNSSTQKIEANEAVWDAYIKAKPDASFYRYKPVKNYEKLSELFGQDRATGSRAAGPKLRRQQWAKENSRACAGINDDGISVSEDIDEFGGDPLTNDTSSSVGVIPSFTTKPPKDPKKKKARLTDVVSEFGSMKAGLDAVARALEHGNARNYDERMLYDEVDKASGLSDISKMKIYQVLTRGVDEARAFLACPAERRDLWLRVRFESLYEDQA